MTSQLERSNGEQARYHKEYLSRTKQANELRAKLSEELLTRDRMQHEFDASNARQSKAVVVLEKKTAHLNRNIEDQTCKTASTAAEQKRAEHTDRGPRSSATSPGSEREERRG